MIQLNPAFLKNPITVNSASISWNLIRITYNNIETNERISHDELIKMIEENEWYM